MRIGRTILAFLLAISVAMLPVAGNAMLRSGPTDMSPMAGADDMSATAGTGMSASADMDMDCCPHQADQSGKAVGGCMAGCALCFSMAMAHPSLVVFSVLPADIGPSFVAHPDRSPPGHPPFRPPRV
jgi:hypothetical protein